MNLIRSAYRGPTSRVGWTSESHLVEGGRTDVTQVLGLITAPGSLLLLLEEEAGEIVACCHLADRGAGLAYLGTVAVQPQRQRGGLGRTLIAEAERRAESTFGSHEIEMTVLAQQEDLIAYYNRRGFHATGEIRPFPADDIFARPLRNDLRFVVLSKGLEPRHSTVGS